MKKLILGVLLAAVPLAAMSSSAVHLDSANIDLSDQASLQRGAKYYFNYCAGCHSLKYMRYNRMGRDLGLTDQQVMDNLMFAGKKIGSNITIAMDPAQSTAWFGVAPPDLTLMVRTKKQGIDWLYSYLRSFYVDPSRPWGVNNIVFPDVGMPHVLWEQQGFQTAVFREETDEYGIKRKIFERFDLETPGELTPPEYDGMIGDLVNFLAYTAEPMKLERQQLGIYVLLFLAVFFVLAYLLKKEYWKDVH
jgi:ubiquinol-cytochrome c reductase cytochrome c1 subunit